MQQAANEGALGRAIRGAREKRHWNLQGVAKSIGKSKQLLSNIETGKIVPTLEVLLLLHEALIPRDDAERDNLLTLWLLKWVAAKAADGIKDADQLQRVQQLLSRLSSPVSRSVSAKQRGGRTLEDFPHGFYPMKAVFGDRREWNPKTPADIFASPVSITDLMFFHTLGFADTVPIVSDKFFVLMDDDFLRREFGQCNLLVVGSPGVNLASRVINAHAIFRFDLSAEARQFEKSLREFRELDDLNYLRVFWDMAQDPAHINLAKYKNSGVSEEMRQKLADKVQALLGTQKTELMTDNFRKPGLVDAFHRYVTAKVTGDHNDYGLISLARNPFAESDDFVAIMVAGIHGPGTAHALRMLSKPRNFARHPFGGIIEVTLNPRLDWPSRFEKACWQWQTQKEGYTADELIANLENALAHPDDNHSAAFVNYTDAEKRGCIEFISHIAGLTGREDSTHR